MDPKKELFTINNQIYSTFEYEHRRVRPISTRGDAHDYYSHNEHASKTVITNQATFDIVVDVPAIVNLVLRRAASNKTGKANLLDGLATAKRRGKPVVLSRVKTDIQVREGYELVEPKA